MENSSYEKINNIIETIKSTNREINDIILNVSNFKNEINQKITETELEINNQKKEMKDFLENIKSGKKVEQNKFNELISNSDSLTKINSLSEYLNEKINLLTKIKDILFLSENNFNTEILKEPIYISPNNNYINNNNINKNLLSKKKRGRPKKKKSSEEIEETSYNSENHDNNLIKKNEVFFTL